MNYDYILIGENKQLDCIVLDRKRQLILEINNGNYTDTTKKCKTMYNRAKSFINSKQGVAWYRYITGEIDRNSINIFSSNLIIETNNRTEFDTILLDTMTQQCNFRLQYIQSKVDNLKQGKQYYIYEFSNID